MKKGLKNLKCLKAFTLTELLVVIAIIGILATIVVVNLAGSRARARDADRINDLTQVAAALELFKADNHVYPDHSGSNDVARFNNLVAQTGLLVSGRYLENQISNSVAPRKEYRCPSENSYYLRFAPEVPSNRTSGNYYYIKNGSVCRSNCTSL